MMKNLPIYELTLDENTEGMYAISLVENPAVESHFYMFSKENEKKLYTLADDKEHCILSCLVRTDFPIYRRDDDGYEYYITFSKETVKQISEKFFQNGYQTNINLEHNDDMWANDKIQLREMFVKDSEKGLSPKGFEDIAEGSLFAVHHINDARLWNECVKGTFNGLSLEGMFKPVETKQKKQKQEISTVEELLDFLSNM